MIISENLKKYDSLAVSGVTDSLSDNLKSRDAGASKKDLKQIKTSAAIYRKSNQNTMYPRPIEKFKLHCSDSW